MRVPLGEYLPDRTDLDNPGATVARNCVPITSESYGPFKTLSTTTGALGARCQGAFAARDAAGNVYHFAGDATDLYCLSVTAWQSCSSASAIHSVATDEHWDLVQYNQRIIAGAAGEKPQSFVMGTSSKFTDLAATTAPYARHLAVVRPGFLMLGNVDDTPVSYASDGAVPNRVWWSALDDPTDYPTIGTADAEAKQSDYNDLETGGWVQSLLGPVGGSDGAVICDTVIYRLDYEGPPTVFRFTPIESSRGTPAPQSVINVGPFAFYLGEDGFYAFDGAQSHAIGNQKVDRDFFAEIDQTYFHRVYAAADHQAKLVFWAYPTGTATNGNPNRILAYNWELGRWSKVHLDVEFIYRALTTGYTLEELDVFGDMETLGFSLDSRVWTGGRITLAGFDSSHKQGYFDGDNLGAVIETGEFAYKEGQRAFCSGVRALVDGGTVTTALRWRDTPGGSLTTNTATSAGSDGVCPQRQAARYFRAQVNIASATSWQHAYGIEPNLKPEGLR